MSNLAENFYIWVYAPRQQTFFDALVIGIFFWGGKVIFPYFFPGVKCFFPVENFHFRRPKTNFSRFQKWKGKKRSSLLLWLFLRLFPIFHLSFYNFPSFLLNNIFSPFHFFPCLFFADTSAKNFPVRSLWGHSAPPCLLCHCSQFKFTKS